MAATTRTIPECPECLPGDLARAETAATQLEEVVVVDPFDGTQGATETEATEETSASNKPPETRSRWCRVLGNVVFVLLTLFSLACFLEGSISGIRNAPEYVEAMRSINHPEIIAHDQKMFEETGKCAYYRGEDPEEDSAAWYISEIVYMTGNALLPALVLLHWTALWRGRRRLIPVWTIYLVAAILFLWSLVTLSVAAFEPIHPCVHRTLERYVMMRAAIGMISIVYNFLVTKFWIHATRHAPETASPEDT